MAMLIKKNINPSNITKNINLIPIYSTSIGLVEHGHNQLTSDLVAESNQTLWSKLLKIVKSEY